MPDELEDIKKEEEETYKRQLIRSHAAMFGYTRGDTFQEEEEKQYRKQGIASHSEQLEIVQDRIKEQRKKDKQERNEADERFKKGEKKKGPYDWANLLVNKNRGLIK